MLSRFNDLYQQNLGNLIFQTANEKTQNIQIVCRERKQPVSMIFRLKTTWPRLTSSHMHLLTFSSRFQINCSSSKSVTGSVMFYADPGTRNDFLMFFPFYVNYWLIMSRPCLGDSFALDQVSILLFGITEWNTYNN